MKSNKHFSQINFIRFVCCIGIIIYHYSFYTANKSTFFQYISGSNMGSIIVTIFFIVSGFVLYCNNNKIDSLKEFYYKRFKSIFPSFYICWFVFYLINVVKVRNPFYAGNPIKFLLTLIGQDGYFIQRIVNYYTVGEWFLGALIFVYALYPLLLKAFNKNDKLTLFTLICLTSIVYIFDIPVISPGFPGICESCLKFCFGMMIYKHVNLLENKHIIFSSIICTVLLLVFKKMISHVFIELLFSLALFILLYNLGNTVKCKFVEEISGISYQVYLFQHLIIIDLLEIYNPTNLLPSLFMLMICIIVILLCAKMLNVLVRRIQKSKIYLKIENKILNN